MTSSEKNSLICLLDDDLAVLRANTRLLISANWQVEAFSAPNRFLEYARRNQPPVAILDMMMPVMDGLAVQAELREVSPNTRVIILTSNDDPEAETIAGEAGVFAFFYKPVDPEDFLASIASAMEDFGAIRRE